jgi:phosphatidate cytidylyltransferase
LEQPVEVKKEGKFAALPARIGSALGLVLVAGTSLYLGGNVWFGFVAVCAAIMLYEWYGLTKTFSKLWQVAGVAYVGVPCVSLYLLQHVYFSDILTLVEGIALIIQLIAMIAATDIGAYFSGKIIGGAKLAPRISPNKTWAGLLGGMSCAMAVSYYVHSAQMEVVAKLAIGAAIAVLGQAGDIFESWLKRRAGVKDSGKILPGHGGLLDRFDGLTLTAPFYVLIVLFYYGGKL